MGRGVKMFDVEELLSKKNQKMALEHLLSKKDGCGRDGVKISDFQEYWEVNHENIEQEIREGTYIPGIIKTYEIVNNRGKQRVVSSLNVTDRMITRMLAQKLKRYVEPKFMPESFAYQENKGILPAVIKAKEYAEKGWKWIRFADNLYLFIDKNEDAVEIFNHLCEKIINEYQLNINMKKSGIHHIYENSMLGYMFYKSKDKIEVKKKQYKKNVLFQQWNQSVVQKVDREYHIIQDGILNKKDYSLLFENEEEKHHIPVGTTNCINMYGNITIASNVLMTLKNEGIAINFFDKYGNIVGHFVPENYGYYSSALLKQCETYITSDIRLKIAKKMEIAGIHNMKANLKYYDKKGYALEEQIKALSIETASVNEGKSIEEIMLIEARARQIYYAAFNEILKNYVEFKFSKRTKRPPRDEINAMISFGNTLLYNQFLQIISKTSLDPRIGMVHATNRRNYSLNLDFADIFKPVISDRVIFSLINYRQIKADKHFQRNEDGSVYMNKTGKRIFLEKFEEKLNSKIVVKNKSYSYKNLMIEEVRNYQKYILHNEKYTPYKYY